MAFLVPSSFKRRRISASCVFLFGALKLLDAAPSSATVDLEAIQSVQNELPIERQSGLRYQHQRQRRQQFLPFSFSYSSDEGTLRYTQKDSGETTNRNAGTDDYTAPRIVGGTLADADAYPFFVEWSRGCGGSLIHPDLVLSAAHCYSPTSSKNTVWVGGINSEHARERTIVEAIVHPQYNKAQEAYDFVILRLSEEIRGAIQPVELNTYPNHYQESTEGEHMTVIGYGVTDVVDGITSLTLLEAQVNYIADCSATSSYEPGIVQEDIMFCAGVPQGQVDSCQGDSGGPILDANNRQIGLVSFGRGCGEADYPGVYARVSSVSAWLENAKCLSQTHLPDDCVEIRIDIRYDGYPQENGWALYDSLNNQMVYRVKTGKVTTQGDVSTALRVKVGNYRFTMYDKMGDGICCVYGEGYISIYTGDNFVEASGSFAYETSLTFKVNPVQGQANTQKQTYTHKVGMRVSINYDNYPAENSWQLMNDNTGAIVDESSGTTPGLWTKDYHHLSPGHYWFSISDSSFDGMCCLGGNGFVQIDQIDANGNVVKNLYYNSGHFGDFDENDFEVI